MKLYIIKNDFFHGDYKVAQIATNEANGDLLYAVDGDLQQFEANNSNAKEYYEADWFQNAFPDAPGDTPLEKYLNGINGVTVNNPPKWNNILPALASSSFFTKILTTQNPNAFSALQTVVQYRNLDLFMALAKATLEAIPGDLSREELEELGGILADNNFPSVVYFSDCSKTYQVNIKLTYNVLPQFDLSGGIFIWYFSYTFTGIFQSFTPNFDPFDNFLPGYRRDGIAGRIAYKNCANETITLNPVVSAYAFENPDNFPLTGVGGRNMTFNNAEIISILEVM
jgi:hypothetical protein